MRKHTQFTALLLAVSLLFNTAVFPVASEGTLESEPTAVSVEGTTAPVPETTAPVVETTAPVVETTAPVVETTTPVVETTAPVVETTAPVVETTAPVVETTAPVVETTAPVVETTAPVVETTAPAQETTAPAQETTSPTQAPETIIDTGVVVCDTSVNIRSGPGTDYAFLESAYNGQKVNIYEIVQLPDARWGRIGEGRWICLTYVQLDSEKTTTPTEGTTAPSVETTAPSVETTIPSVETTAPSEGTTSPSEGTTAPSEDTTNPTEETTDPTEEAADPTEEATDPTEETTDPQALLTAELEAILSAQVVPQQMSLTWWAARCGRINTPVLLSEEGNEDTEVPPLHFEPEDSTLQIASAQELLLLSYVEPQAYENLQLTFYPSSEENAGFGLLSQLDGLDFLGLGSEEYPFRGEILFTEQTGPILLNQPLFNALCDDAKITGLSLESYVQGIAEGGLLAKTVTHAQGGNTWKITLTQPEPEENTEVNLPPLIFNLANNANISLDVTDLSGLQVLGSGYICAVMDENAQLSLSGIRNIPSVTGYSDAVGGLVGLMKSGASLSVIGDSLSICGVSGNWNAGGIVGSATDPQLSLPPVVGSDGAAIHGENVGGCIGRLALSAGEHSMSLSAANLTLNGSVNAGGLFGILRQEEGIFSLNSQVENISFGESALGNTGSLMGTFQAPNLETALILDGEPITDASVFEGLAGLVDYPDTPQETEATETEPEPTENKATEPQTEESTVHVITVEEAQAILDYFTNAEVKPGEMSLAWWAASTGKITAEELAAELNAIYSSATETTFQTEASAEAVSTQTSEAAQEPESTEESETTETVVEIETTVITEDSTETESTEDPTEAANAVVTEAPTEAETTAATEAPTETETTAATEAAQEENNLPQETTQGEAEEHTQEDILNQEDVLLMKYANLVPMVSMEDLSAGSAQTSGESGESAILLNNELLAAATNIITNYSIEDGQIRSAEELVSLSLVEALDYATKPYTIYSISNWDLVKTEVEDNDGVKHTFQGLGSDAHPFQGSLKLADGSLNNCLILDKPLFNALDQSATVKVNLYSGLTGETYVDGLLAKKITALGTTSQSTWDVALYAIKGTYSPSLVGTMGADSQVSMNLKLVVGTRTEGDSTITSAGDYNNLTILGSGYLCKTMGASAQMSVNLVADGNNGVGIPSVKSNSNQDAGGLVGTMGNNAQLSVTFPQGKTSLPIRNVTAGGNAGGLVGHILGSGAAMSFPEGTVLTIGNVTSESGNAGGVVGTMESGAQVPVTNAISLSVGNVTAGNSAGGLVGEATDPGIASLPSIVNSANATISGKKAGGLIGRLDNTKNASFSLNANVQNLTIKGSESAGGLFGELHNDKGAAEDAIAYSITQSVTASISAITLTGGDAGGLIGKYYTDDLVNTLEISHINVESIVPSESGATWFGGAIGNVASGIAAYVKFNDLTISTSGNPSNFGGLIGQLSEAGHLIEVGSVRVQSTCTSKGIVGGIVGSMPCGVLYLTAVPTELSITTLFCNDNRAYRGWILGSRGNTLVYTTAANWDNSRGSDTNDTGVWGQVLLAHSGSKLDGILTLGDGNSHTVTVQAVNKDQETGSLTVASEKDFATVSLRLQLDEKETTSGGITVKGALRFSDGDLDTSGTITISLNASIDLNDTGLTCLTRDVGKDNTFSPVFNIQITGTITENVAPTITLPTLKVYTISGSHDRQGLIAKAGTLTVSNLTLATTSGTDGVQTHLINNGNTYTGLLAAEASGDVTLNNVTSSAKLKITGSAGNNTSRAAGLIAQVTKDSTALKFTNCTWSGTIQDDASGNDRCAGFLAYSDKKSTRYQFTSCFVKGTINKTSKVDYVSVGGLISALSSGTDITLDINGLEVNGANITATGTNDSQRCGGLLGYEWFNVKATISNVTVQNSTLSAGNSNFGGLVYKGSGYWQIGREQEDGTVQAGVTFTGTNTFNGASSEGAPSGLLVCHGDKVDDDITKSALYLEVLPGAYTIKGTISGVDNFTSFDELVGTTISADGLNNGIVSIATEGHAPIDQGTCNTYKQHISGTQWNNKNTRYYYNLDFFRKNLGLGYDDKIATDTDNINSAEKMVLFSAWSHCHSGLQQYFLKSAPSKITNPAGGELDLTGYSYYPVPFRGTSIENATIKFDYEGLETAEGSGISLAGGGTAANKKPSNQDCQHSGMHTGIFTNKLNAENTGAGTLFVNNLTLSGTVGGSAILNGTARGNGSGSDEMMKLSLTKITLDGIRTSSAASALLIDSIGSFTSMQLTDVTTTNAYQSLTGFTHAATSLIGKVGEVGSNGQDGKYIQLDFAQIALDGRINADANSTIVHNTTHSIFSEALFLQEFQYTDSNSWGVYNFTQTDEENRVNYYTLGRELSNAENAANVRNGGEQFYFYGTEDYIYCVVGNTSEGNDADAAAYFTDEAYRRYVGNKESTPAPTYHEMDINLSSKDIVTGCGTYSDPYIIEYGKQLSAVAKVLNGESPKKNWKVTMNTAVLSGGLSSQYGHTSGNGTDDNTFTWDGSKWVCTGQESPATADVIKYLRNAYYQLKNNSTEENEGNGGKINLSSNWGGLGSKTNPFQGVIVGENGVTVHIDVKTGTQFGGLIAFSNGSVVKNVNIHYDHAPSITYSSTTAPSTISAPFFGGVVGWCIGGDTIIDGVTITYAEGVAPTVTGTMAYLVPVGGYVGLVGGTEGLDSTTNGLGGGVVFRNITTSSSLPNVTVDGTAVSPSDENGNYFYVNPYVGRVLDGYAVNEGSEFINTDKNYKIPSLSSPGLTFADRKISISNNEGLWLLSAIVNSGAGSGTAKAYTEGKARFCNYDTVGGNLPDGGVPDENSGASPYLIRKFSLDNAFKTITASTASAVSIELTMDCDMRDYGNGFRGIGTSYSANNNYNRLIKVKELDGGSKTVTLAQNRKEYLDEGSNWTSIGAGLFVRLYQDSSSNSTTIKNLTLTGSTGITYYNGTGSDTNNSNGVLYKAIKDKDLYGNRLNQVGAGMLASSVANVGTTDLTIENVTLANVNVNSGDFCSVFAGGMIGVIWGGGGSSSNDYLTVTLKDCAYTYPTVRGFVDAGGFIGRVRADSNSNAKIVITYSKNASLTGGDIATTSTTYERNNNFSTVGGLIGCTYYYDLAIQPQESTNAMLTISDLNVKSGYTGNTGDRVFGGGLVGLCYTPKTDCTIQNVTFKGNNSISGADSNNRRQLLGGLIGTLANDVSNWTNSGSASATISNIHIAESGSMTIQYGQQVGGLFGILKLGGEVTISDITIGSNGSSSSSPSMVIRNIRNDININCNIGGLIGGGNALNTVSVEKLKMFNVYVVMNNNSDKDTRGAALLFGFLENRMNDTSSIDITEITLENCQIIRCASRNRAGFIYGYINNSVPTIAGNNILIEGCTIGYDASLPTDICDLPSQSYTPSSEREGDAVGIIGGHCANDTNVIQLIGVRVKNCAAPARDFGTSKPNSSSYVVRADYTGQAEAASNITTVPTSTISIMETGASSAKTLTSDGACFYSQEPTTSIAEQIMREYYGGVTCNSYFSIGSAITTFASKSGDTVTISEMLSTFHIAGEISDTTIPNFPVLVINSNEGSNANSIVQDYIAVLTNDTVAPRSIIAATYKWSPTSEATGGAFTIVENASLNVANDGTVSITPGAYDNQRNQFTLLDVTYADPTGGGNVYHLYIPVIVKKVLEFKFRAAAENGTTYSAGVYAGKTERVIGSNMDQITALLTLEYQRSKAEWQAAVDNGENLLWNFDKEIVLRYSGDAKMPETTRLTLVDRNDGDKAYTCCYSGENISFSNFAAISDEKKWSCSNVLLCDLLGLTAQEVNNKENAKYICLGTNSDGATLRIGTQYYRPVKDTENADKYYNISVGLGDGVKAAETYYLTIQTPKSETGSIYNFRIQYGDSLENPRDKDGKPLPSTPKTKLESYSNNNSFGNREENIIIIGDFFKQAFLVNANGANLMSETNRSIKVNLSTTIEFASPDAQTNYQGYGGDLYQQFWISLSKVNENQVENVAFADGTKLTFNSQDYEPGGEYTYWLKPFNTIAKDDLTKNLSYTCNATVTLEYTTQGILDQFPANPDGSNNIGIRINAGSSLALDSGALLRSNLRDSGSDSNLFYRKDISVATLSYNAYDQAQSNPQDSGLGNLGINGRLQKNGIIDSAALYNCSQVVGAQDATKLKLTLELLQKQDNGKYLLVTPDYTNFLNIPSISAQVIGGGGTITWNGQVSGGVATLGLQGYDGHSPIKIDVKLDVKTGADAEALTDFKYANYRVKLTAELRDSTGTTISGSKADDYIVYTNAKIINSLITTS